MTPTQRTLKWYRDLGKKIWVVEYWNSFCKRRVDLFGFADLVCCLDKPTLIQCTSLANHTTRVKKIKAEPCRTYAEAWLISGGQILVMSWEKGKRGAPRAEYITLADLRVDSIAA